MNEYVMRITQVTMHFDEKKNRKLHIDPFIRLCSKVGEESSEINSLIEETYSLLVELSNNPDCKYKSFSKSFFGLRKKVRKRLGYSQKGSIQEEYTAIGIAMGVAIGSGFSSLNTSLIGVGIPIGLAIGVSLGKKKEREAEEAGKTY